MEAAQNDASSCHPTSATRLWLSAHECNRRRSRAAAEGSSATRSFQLQPVQGSWARRYINYRVRQDSTRHEKCSKSARFRLHI